MPHSENVPLGLASWQRSMDAVEKGLQQLLRTTSALDADRIQYAVIGGHAVASWVSSADPGGVRNTRDVNILIRREDLKEAVAVLEKAGFTCHETANGRMFFDGPKIGSRSAIQVFFAGEKVRPDDALPAPDLTESERGEHFQVLSLSALIRMKLTSFRIIDRVHLQDMIGVGLIDSSWPARFPPELAARLQQILDNPNG